MASEVLDVIIRNSQKEDGLNTPKKRVRYHKSRIRINPDDFDRAAIRQTIQQFYERRDYPTLRTLLEALREKGVFPGGRSTLSLLLKNMGFKYCRRNDKVYVYERREIVNQRHKFPRSVKKYRREGRPLAYLDETWANAHIVPRENLVRRIRKGWLETSIGARTETYHSPCW